MTTLSQRLGLKKPSTSDDFTTSDIAANWQKIDDHPGVKITTATRTGIAWGASHEGMLIYETDTDTYWQWDGADFNRVFPKGLLGFQTQTTDTSVIVAAAPADVATVTCDVPAGGRNIKVTFTWNQYNSSGNSRIKFSLDGSSGANDFVTLLSATVAGGAGQGGGSVSFLHEAPSEGSHTFGINLAPVVGNGQFLGLRQFFVEEV